MRGDKVRTWPVQPRAASSASWRPLQLPLQLLLLGPVSLHACVCASCPSCPSCPFCLSFLSWLYPLLLLLQALPCCLFSLCWMLQGRAGVLPVQQSAGRDKESENW
jgi:hypothetical protein